MKDGWSTTQIGPLKVILGWFLIYVEGDKIDDTTNIEAEAWAILIAAIDYGHSQFKIVITQIYSLFKLKILRNGVVHEIY